MFIAKVQKSSGEILTLTDRESEWQVIDIQGLNPPAAQINMTQIVGMDGAAYNSSFLNTRNIVIMIRINGDVEKNRQTLESFFSTKRMIRFFYQTESRNLFADGIVQANEYDPFTISEIMQVSIICPSAYLSDADEYFVDLSDSQAGFYFPFSIEVNDPIEFSSYEVGRTTNIINNADAEAGIVFHILVLDDVTNIVIQNVGTGESLSLTGDFDAGDRLLINTDPTNLEMLMTRNGVITNLFPALSLDSVLLTLAPGPNLIGYMVDGHAHDNMVKITATYRQQYRGI